MAEPARNRRAFSLLELLIAIGVLLGLTALVLPAVISGLGARSFESMLDRLSGQVVFARAHAQRTGRAMVLEFDPVESRFVVRHFEPEESLGSGAARFGSEQFSAAADSEFTARASDEYSVSEVMRIPDSWGQVEVDSTIVVSTELPVEDPMASGIDSEEFAKTVSNAMESGPAAQIRLAVFLPDGSAAMRTDVWLEDGESRVAHVRVSSWTGQPRIERVTKRSLLETLADEDQQRDAESESLPPEPPELEKPEENSSDTSSSLKEDEEDEL